MHSTSASWPSARPCNALVSVESWWKPHAAKRACAEFGMLELETRIELTENHAAFARMGFIKTAETSHEGFDRTTSIVMRAPV